MLFAAMPGTHGFYIVQGTHGISLAAVSSLHESVTGFTVVAAVDPTKLLYDFLSGSPIPTDRRTFAVLVGGSGTTG